MLHYSINAKIAYFWMHFPFYGEIFYLHDSLMRINKPITSPKISNIQQNRHKPALHVCCYEAGSSRNILLTRIGMTCTGNCHSHDWKDLKKH